MVAKVDGVGEGGIESLRLADANSCIRMDNQQGPTVQFNTLRQTIMKKNMKRYICCAVTLLYRKEINTTLQINYTLTFFTKKPGPRKIKYLNLRSSSE